MLGGGFYRYSVDAGSGSIPHFEKMLYDNGPLLSDCYALALRRRAEMTSSGWQPNETADWLLRDMRSPGRQRSGQRYDADSEGEEGKFYVWTPAEVASLLDEQSYALVARRYGLDQEANFEGRWHLTVREDVDDPNGRIDAALSSLLETRKLRVPPGLDDKQLTSWNALAIRGMAVAGRVRQRDDLVGAAVTAADFVREKLVIEGRLLASYKDGQARFPAYLDDHAFLVDALLELVQSRWSARHLEFAIMLADLLLEHFEDTDNGGFFFTANDHERLMHRPKPLADEATPSGNGTAALALQRLGHLIGEPRYTNAAERALRSAWKAMDEYPHGHVTLIAALEEYLEPPEIIVIRGDDAEIREWQIELAKIYAPARMVLAIGREETNLPGLLAERVAIAGETIAYRCSGTQCDLPVKSLGALA